MKTLFYIFLGGGLGSVLRYWLSSVSSRFFSVGVFPLGTLMVNIIGCFFIGWLSAFFMKEDSAYKYLLITGFCGGFTTFSAFSMENVSLWQNGQIGWVFLYIMSSVIFGILAVFLGLQLGKG